MDEHGRPLFPQVDESSGFRSTTSIQAGSASRSDPALADESSRTSTLLHHQDEIDESRVPRTSTRLLQQDEIEAQFEYTEILGDVRGPEYAVANPRLERQLGFLTQVQSPIPQTSAGQNLAVPREAGVVRQLENLSLSSGGASGTANESHQHHSPDDESETDEYEEEDSDTSDDGQIIREAEPHSRLHDASSTSCTNGSSDPNNKRQRSTLQSLSQNGSGFSGKRALHQGGDSEGTGDFSDEDGNPLTNKRTRRPRKVETQMRCFVRYCNGQDHAISTLLRGAERCSDFYFCSSCCLVFRSRERFKAHSNEGCQPHCIAPHDYGNGASASVDRRHRRRSSCPSWGSVGPDVKWRYFYHLQNPDSTIPTFTLSMRTSRPHKRPLTETYHHVQQSIEESPTFEIAPGVDNNLVHGPPRHVSEMGNLSDRPSMNLPMEMTSGHQLDVPPPTEGLELVFSDRRATPYNGTPRTSEAELPLPALLVQLTSTRAERDNAEQQLLQVQHELYRCRIERSQAKAQLTNAQNLISSTRAERDEAEARLNNVQDLVSRRRSERDEAKAQLQESQKLSGRLKDVIKGAKGLISRVQADRDEAKAQLQESQRLSGRLKNIIRHVIKKADFSEPDESLCAYLKADAPELIIHLSKDALTEPSVGGQYKLSGHRGQLSGSMRSPSQQTHPSKAPMGMPQTVDASDLGPYEMRIDEEGVPRPIQKEKDAITEEEMLAMLSSVGGAQDARLENESAEFSMVDQLPAFGDSGLEFIDWDAVNTGTSFEGYPTEV